MGGCRDGVSAVNGLETTIRRWVFGMDRWMSRMEWMDGDVCGVEGVGGEVCRVQEGGFPTGGLSTPTARPPARHVSRHHPQQLPGGEGRQG